MLVDALLHGFWPSIAQYCGTLLIAVSFVILAAWQSAWPFYSLVMTITERPWSTLAGLLMMALASQGFAIQARA